MNENFRNPWAELLLQQLWVYRQASAMAAKAVDADLLRDPADYYLNPSKQRLNPLEFHGKRRRSAMQ